MKLCVVGTGYVGLVGAAVFADWGNEVVGVDIDEEKIKKIQSGEMPIYEPGLAEIVLDNIDQGRLTFTTSLAKGMKDADLVFICVGTPQDDKTGAANLSAVLGVAAEIGGNLDGYKVVVTKSTVPVGTNERVKQIVRENAPKGAHFDVASNPEFLREGSSVEDMNVTDRVVIGAESEKAFEKVKSLYDHLNAVIVETDLRSAEMIKYASNSFLATKISFINEMAQICERAGADVSEVAYGMGLDKRVGKYFLRAGIGYGGSCFPKDVAALYKTSTDKAYDFKLLRSVMEVNENQRHYFMDKVTDYFGMNLDGKTIACLGLAFKSNTDDIRESVSIKIVQALRGLGAKIKAYDPKAMENAQGVLGDFGIEYGEGIYEVMKDADGLCLLTEWSQFGELDLERVKQEMKGKVIFDGRNLLDKEAVEKAGFTYFAIGKRTNGGEYGRFEGGSAILKDAS
ncbi:nucleotide sugar dehydrogenase [candidate division WWE3 bacterium]|nr:nucleotide sugar dehydrogenase [candidate division WWE3 bacterium]